jgi:hypothetical protein
MADGAGGGQAVVDGGLTKGARITGDQRSSLAKVFGERYAGGESIRSIAADTGRSYGFVHGVLKESGASLRGRGGATRGPRRGPLEKLADQVDAATGSVAASMERTKAKASKAKAAKDDRPKKKAEVKKSGKAKKSAKKS